MRLVVGFSVCFDSGIGGEIGIRTEYRWGN